MQLAMQICENYKQDFFALTHSESLDTQNTRIIWIRKLVISWKSHGLSWNNVNIIYWDFTMRPRNHETLDSIWSWDHEWGLTPAQLRLQLVTNGSGLMVSCKVPELKLFYTNSVYCNWPDPKRTFINWPNKNWAILCEPIKVPCPNDVSCSTLSYPIQSRPTRAASFWSHSTRVLYCEETN